MENAELGQIALNISDSMKMGGAFLKARKLKEAESVFRQVVSLEPHHIGANSALGVTLIEDDRPEDALPILDRAALIAREELFVLGCNRGKALADLGRSNEALAAFDNILRVCPDHLLAKYDRGLVYLQMNRFSEAIAAFTEVLERQPGHNSARFGRAFANLVLGNYADGFREYECRKKDEVIEPLAPPWTGEENICGKRVLVYADQGLGDNVMFGRYIPKMIERGADVTLGLPPVMKPLFAHLPVQFLEDGPREKWPEDFDYWARMMSLGWCLRTVRETIPSPLPLEYDERRMRVARSLVPAQTGRRNIGLCWSGSRRSLYDKFRNIPLAMLEPLLQLPGIQFYSLQHDIRERDRPVFEDFKARYGLIDAVDGMVDFRESAHVIKCLDAVVCCDTGLTHLAGTVGVPTYVMLTAFRTYWLWIQQLKDSPWYPSIKVIRQPADGDWGSVLARVRDDLSWA